MKSNKQSITKSKVFQDKYKRQNLVILHLGGGGGGQWVSDGQEVWALKAV